MTLSGDAFFVDDPVKMKLLVRALTQYDWFSNYMGEIWTQTQSYRENAMWRERIRGKAWVRSGWHPSLPSLLLYNSEQPEQPFSIVSVKTGYSLILLFLAFNNSFPFFSFLFLNNYRSKGRCFSIYFEHVSRLGGVCISLLGLPIQSTTNCVA